MAEVWRTKDRLAAKYNYSVAAMFADLREREKTSGRHYVDLSQPAKRGTKRKRTAAAKH